MIIIIKKCIFPVIKLISIKCFWLESFLNLPISKHFFKLLIIIYTNYIIICTL